MLRRPCYSPGMAKRVNARDPKQRLGTLLDDVRLTGTEYVIERASQPAAVIIPVETYRRYQQAREEAFDRIEALRQQLAENEDPTELEAAIVEAAREVLH